MERKLPTCEPNVRIAKFYYNRIPNFRLSCLRASIICMGASLLNKFGISTCLLPSKKLKRYLIIIMPWECRSCSNARCKVGKVKCVKNQLPTFSSVMVANGHIGLLKTAWSRPILAPPTPKLYLFIATFDCCSRSKQYMHMRACAFESIKNGVLQSAASYSNCALPTCFGIKAVFNIKTLKF